jgi:hypothetical protein
MIKLIIKDLSMDEFEFARNKSYRYDILHESLIVPYQKRAKIRHSNCKCSIVHCKTIMPQSNTIQFCDKHKWVKTQHESRHEGGSRLPVLLMVYDNTPYRHVKAAGHEINYMFDIYVDIYINHVERICRREVKFSEIKKYIPEEYIYVFKGFNDNDYFSEVGNAHIRLQQIISSIEYWSEDWSENYSDDISIENIDDWITENNELLINEWC